MVLHWAINDWEAPPLEVCPEGTNKVGCYCCGVEFAWIENSMVLHWAINDWEAPSQELYPERTNKVHYDNDILINCIFACMADAEGSV
jgi:hypothetical protein